MPRVRRRRAPPASRRRPGAASRRRADRGSPVAALAGPTWRLLLGAEAFLVQVPRLPPADLARLYQRPGDARNGAPVGGLIEEVFGLAEQPLLQPLRLAV